MPNSLELNVSPAQLHTFANHPFHVRKDMEMNELVDSIRESGVIVPLIVRSRPEGGYEIISGHRRCEACRELGIEKVPVRVQELTDDEATILMVNSNIQREHVLPSEKAFAYKMRMDAMKHQGRATSAQLGPKLSSEVLAEQVGESRNQIKRYMAGVTKEEIARAKELDLLTYFKLVEPGNLKLVGKEYRHKVHSSLTISKNSLWCWHCIGLRGRTALKYLIDVEKVPYVEAVREINRIQGSVVHSSQPVSLPQPRAEPEAPRDFKLHLVYIEVGLGVILASFSSGHEMAPPNLCIKSV